MTIMRLTSDKVCAKYSVPTVIRRPLLHRTFQRFSCLRRLRLYIVAPKGPVH